MMQTVYIVIVDFPSTGETCIYGVYNNYDKARQEENKVYSIMTKLLPSMEIHIRVVGPIEVEE
jgi:hypothetical protein